MSEQCENDQLENDQLENESPKNDLRENIILGPSDYGINLDEYRNKLISFVEFFVETKILFEKKTFSVSEIFYEINKLWPYANIDNFRKVISRSKFIKISEDDVISYDVISYDKDRD